MGDTATETPQKVAFRLGTEADARAIAELSSIATDDYLEKAWREIAGADQDWRDVGATFVLDPYQRMYFKRCIVCMVDGKIAGMLNGYPLAPFFDPASLEDENPVIRAYSALQERVKDSFYLANMAVYPPYRQKGLARHLLDVAFDAAFNMNFPRVSATVHETKEALLAHYARRGMTIIDERNVRLTPEHREDAKLYLLTLDAPEKPRDGDA